MGSNSIAASAAVDQEVAQSPERSISKPPWKPSKERLCLIREKISKEPRLLTHYAGNVSCCIFRVPTRFVEANGKSYQPEIVSIGPYHRGDPALEMIEEHKWGYLGSLLSRTEAAGVSLEDIMAAVEPLVPAARECYSEVIHLDTEEFVEMMVVDGLFMIELFRKTARIVAFESSDPLVRMAWIFPFFYRDFLRLENQVPYFVLERLFDLTKVNQEHSLTRIALEFFNNAMRRLDEDIAGYHGTTARHLLDLVRSSFMPHDIDQPLGPPPTHVVHCVSRLVLAGIQLRPARGCRSFLAVGFRDGVIEMPALTIDDFMSSFLVNCVAYEQCHHDESKHFTAYATLLDCLVNKHRDVEYLSDISIVENYYGTNADVARFINGLSKDVAFDIDQCYLAPFFNDVHEYYSNNNWHVQWSAFDAYLSNIKPCWFISGVAALVLLIMSLIQTIYTVTEY
ncbi:hypothetical protein SAY86_018506 [Trapa natans]|uniref:Uncharacterized protein n=1 Tax=Trapa natans TaxID=22666 RepID=A0AAN7LAD3_TRANT|nr:hypothetical protein SAY86_018506 [Trapa natans]